MSTYTESLDKLKADLKTLGQDIADLGDRIAADVGTKVDAACEKARDTARELPGRSRDALAAASDKTDTLVREKPYQVLGVAALAGLALGVLLGRK